MIIMSDAAVQEAKRLLEKQGKLGWGVRVGVHGGGCSGLSYKMHFAEAPDEKDKVFEYDGLKIWTDVKSYLYLNGLTLDFSNELIGGGFQFLNPNAKSTCSCGQSFNA